MKKYLVGLSSTLALPFIAMAQTTLSGDSNLTQVITFISQIFNYAIALAIGLAGVYFVWSLVGYLSKGGSDKDEAKGHMIWGIVIIAVMLAFWGLVGIVKSSVFGSGVQQLQSSDIPKVPTN